MFNFEKYLVQLLIAKKVSDDSGRPFVIDRYAGIAFLIHPQMIATCAHIVDMVQPGEVLVARNQITNGMAEVQMQKHARYDFAAGIFQGTADLGVLPLSSRKFLPGEDVSVMGYTPNGKTGNFVHVDARMFKGHLVRVADEATRPEARSTIEVSFAAHKGFSGTPLISKDSEIVGMLFGSAESEIVSHSVAITNDDGSVFAETKSRIVELGLAHSNIDLLQFMQDLADDFGKQS